MTNPPADPKRSRAAATSVVRTLRAAGHEAYLVGGCVREHLLGLEPTDHDVTTDALPDRVVALFPRAIEVGARFGVVTVVQEGVHVEVATFRTEGSYSDGRRPDSVRFASAREDVLRRDFTINALLQDPETGAVIDHVGGRADLAAGVVRAVGDPVQRFSEDHLRLLRAARFAARLGFRLEDATHDAVRQLAPRVTRVSAERLREELARMLVHPTRAQGVRLLDELGLLRHVLPEVDAMHGVAQPPQVHPEGDVFVHTLLVLEALPDAVSEAVAWAALLHDVGKPATITHGPDRIRFHGHETVGARMSAEILERLRASLALRDRVEVLVARHLQPRDAPRMRRATLRRLLAEPFVDELLVLCRADAAGGSGDVSHLEVIDRARAELGEAAAMPPPLVTGDDLRATGLPPGPAYGRILEALRDEQLEGALSTREAALARLREMLAGGGAGTTSSELNSRPGAKKRL